MSPNRIQVEKQIRLAQIRFLEEAIQYREAELQQLEEAERQLPPPVKKKPEADWQGVTCKLTPRESPCHRKRRRGTMLIAGIMILGVLLAIYLVMVALAYS